MRGAVELSSSVQMPQGKTTPHYTHSRLGLPLPRHNKHALPIRSPHSLSPFQCSLVVQSAARMIRCKQGCDLLSSAQLTPLPPHTHTHAQAGTTTCSHTHKQRDAEGLGHKPKGQAHALRTSHLARMHAKSLPHSSCFPCSDADASPSPTPIHPPSHTTHPPPSNQTPLLLSPT